jgi:DNA-binding response OmpR family regulator
MVDSLAPDLILLDITLPTMDGYQVCARLKRDENTAHIPIIMLTSIESADGTLQGLEMGADDFIAKDTFMAENLLATVEVYFNILTGGA